MGIIWNYNDVLRTLNVKVPLVSNGGISVFDTGITLDQCAYAPLVLKKKSGQNGDGTQRYMQWLGEPDDLKRFVLRPSTNGGGYLGSTSMRWNTGFFTNTITQSDKKDKIHVQELGEKALSFLSALRPVSFVFKDGEGGRTHLGLIAQEVASAAVWLICNEVISILENIGDIGVPLPGFLTKIVQGLRSKLEEKTENKK